MTTFPLQPTDPVTLGVLRALAEGVTDQEAAHRVHVSTRTVQRVVDNFKQSAGVRTRFAAGAAACRLGLLDEAAGPPHRSDPSGRGWSAPSAG